MTMEWEWKTPKPTGNLSVGKILKNVAIAYPNKRMIDATTGTIRTYKEMNERVNRIANSLLASACQFGDYITVLTRWSLETQEMYFACARAGLVIIPVSYRLLPQEIENIMRYVDSRVIVFDESFAGLVNQISLDLKKYVIGTGTDKFIPFEELLQSQPEEPRPIIEDQTLVTLGFTSGTTGSPKVFLRAHYSNFNNHIGCVLSFDMTYQDVGLTAIPPLTGVTWNAGLMLARAEAIVMDFDPVKVLETIEKYKVTVLFLVPAMYNALLSVSNLERYDLSSLRAVASVGSFLPLPVLEGIRKYISPNVYDEFGLQEAGFVSVIKPDMKVLKPSSAGPPVPLHEIKIVDSEDLELPPDQIGEVVVKTADGVGAYWNNPEKNKESFKNGWFYTGDLGKLDEDGYLYIVGRKKDMIVSGGYNVYATDVEDIILGNPDVEDCAVIGLPDSKWGEKVTAVIKLKAGRTVSESSLITYCKERLSSYKVPKSVIFTNVIPRTLSGKAMKFKLIEQFRDNS